MDFSLLTYQELKGIAIKMKIPVRREKSKMLEDITTEYQRIKSEKRKVKAARYTRVKQLGEKGKEGTTVLVTTAKGNEYAMKTFRKQKSSTTLKKEAMLQKLVAATGAAPQVVEINTDSKYIVMERMDRHLMDVMKRQNGVMSLIQQKQIIGLYKKMDQAGVFHGDTNLLNYMYKGRKLYIIDFGMSKAITPDLVKKLGTSTPNISIMTLGLVLKLRDMKCPLESWSYLRKYLSVEKCVKFNVPE